MRWLGSRPRLMLALGLAGGLDVGIAHAAERAGRRQLTSNPEVPQRQHIHVVVRTPNRNDYGKDLLRQHLALHKH